MKTEEQPDFPPQCKRFLTAFYSAKSATTVFSKKKALLDSFGFGNATLTADGLRVAEFYVLTKLKML